MNWKKIFTIAALTGFSASVATGQGTAPTIVQGDYISNVFGQSNFVKNPNAKLNNANVTVSSATVTRSTTTPLVATSEFNITTSTSTGYAEWTTRTFDAGMKNQNCEARFTYRGFAVATTTAQIVQGSNTVAQLTLTPSTDPRIASINFPCGDLSSATTLRVQQATASLTGTNEIGGIYVGLATNQANVAQAEAVVIASKTNAQTIAAGGSTISYNTEQLDAYNEFDTSTGIYTAKRAGLYQIDASIMLDSASYAVGTRIDFSIRKNGVTPVVINGLDTQQATSTRYWSIQRTATVQLAVGDTLSAFLGTAGSLTLYTDVNSEFNRLFIKRFPTSSELVVTPERQNVFAGIEWSSTNTFTGTATSYTTVNSSSVFTSPSTFGTATAAGTSCGLTANDAGFCMETLPPGTYKIGANLQVGVTPSSADDFCSYSISIGGGTLSDQNVIDAIPRSASTSINAVPYLGFGTGLVKITSLQKNVRVWLRYKKNATAASCVVRSDTSSFVAKPSIHIQPLDQPSNSALYVQGPVLASQTGAAVTSSYLGYIKEGTERAGTGGKSWSVRSTTVPTTSQAALVTITLDKGIWFVSGYAQGGTTAATTFFEGCLRVGGTCVSGTPSTPANATAYGSIFFSMPILITADSTAVAIWGAIGTGTGATNGHEITAIRLN